MIPSPCTSDLGRLFAAAAIGLSAAAPLGCGRAEPESAPAPSASPPAASECTDEDAETRVRQVMAALTLTQSNAIAWAAPSGLLIETNPPRVRNLLERGGAWEEVDAAPGRDASLPVTSPAHPGASALFIEFDAEGAPVDAALAPPAGLSALAPGAVRTHELAIACGARQWRLRIDPTVGRVSVMGPDSSP